ncbi:hypothetical protein F5883DRAFT_709447 [Diaporthe sp. PMI_573]|nr:hypothetical protein F5883DRAFT_709447 [Diaporthaceae sp. PMI_573]
MSLILAKAAILDHYLRVLDSNKSKARLFLKRILVSLLIVQGAEETLVSLFSCQPQTGKAIVRLNGVCFEQRPMWFTGFTLNLIFDLVLFLQPMAALWNRRRLPLSEKIGPLLSLLGISLVSVTTVGRAAVVVNISNDITYDYPVPLIWSVAEADAIVLYSTLPSFLILFKALRKAGRSKDKQSSHTRQSTSLSNMSPVHSEGTGSHELLTPVEPHPGQPVQLHGGLGPTPGERVSWIEKTQAFPVGERSQQEMTRRQIGTTSVVEVLPKALAPSAASGRGEGPWVEFANWTDTASERGIASEEEEGEPARVCSEPAEYVDSISPQLGGIFVLDTDGGIVHWYGCYGELNYSEDAIEDDPYDWAPEDEAE